MTRRITRPPAVRVTRSEQVACLQETISQGNYRINCREISRRLLVDLLLEGQGFPEADHEDREDNPVPVRMAH